MPNKVFIFFNCDAEKSAASMNIFYNSVVYGNSLISRNVLLSKVMAELEAGRVKIADENVKKVQSMILKGDPVAASELIQYGAIRELDFN